MRLATRGVVAIAHGVRKKFFFSVDKFIWDRERRTGGCCRKGLNYIFRRVKRKLVRGTFGVLKLSVGSRTMMPFIRSPFLRIFRIYRTKSHEENIQLSQIEFFFFSLVRSLMRVVEERGAVRSALIMQMVNHCGNRRSGGRAERLLLCWVAK